MRLAGLEVAHRRRPRAWCRRGCRRPSLSQRKLILWFLNARSCMIFEARSSSRRWMIVTLSANLVRNVASSMAESPPPTTAMSWPRKKKPSQVAQVDRPWPMRRVLRRQAEHQRLGAGGDDDGSRQVGGLGRVGSPTQTLNGRSEKSTLDTFSRSGSRRRSGSPAPGS